MSQQLFSKPIYRNAIALLIMSTVAAMGTVLYGLFRVGAVNQNDPTPVISSASRKISALGRLEPQTEVIRLSAPVNLDGDRLAEVLVKQGERVAKGQVIAILDSRDRLQAALQESREQVRIAQSRLAQVKAGAKSGEIQAQESAIVKLQAELQGEVAAQTAVIARLQAEFRNAETEFNRYLQLYQSGVVSSSILDSKRLASDTAKARWREATADQNRTIGILQAQIRASRATLSQITEVRPVDIEVAQAEVDSAIAAAKRAETDLNSAYVRASVAGQILKVQARLGEKIEDVGIAELGQTAEMVAIAEVYQSDINKIRVGQRAIVTGDAFSGELQGKVSEIGLQVSRQNTFSTEPGENLDRRVVEVKIQLSAQDSKRVAGLTNLQIQASISP